MLDQIGGMMQKTRSHPDPVRRAAHFLLCFNYQGYAKMDPPMIDGECQWRVWHLDHKARDIMNSVEQDLYDALMGDFTTAA